jgi:uncharacterized protein (TIGR02646 family)
MIGLRRPQRVPSILSGRGSRETQRLCDAFDQGIRTFEFNSGIYNAASVKKALAVAQNYKCCYCESKFLHSSYGDIDHFRPKAGVRQQAGDPEIQPGYYWLAYDFTNLLFSCEVCNRSHKRTRFPLKNPIARAHDHHSDLTQETPLLINPMEEDPTQHIGFREEYPFPIGGSERGKATIECTGLDREPLNEARRDHLGYIRALWKLSRMNPQDVPEATEAKRYLANLCAESGVFSAAARAHRDHLDSQG